MTYRLHCNCPSCDLVAQEEEALAVALETIEVWRERALDAERQVRELEAAQAELLSACGC